MTAGDVLYVLANAAVSLAAVVMWAVAARRAAHLHRVHHDARSLHVATVTLAVLLASVGTLGPLLAYLGWNAQVLGDLNEAATFLGRVLAGAGRASLAVAGIALVLDRGNWRKQR